MQTCETFFFIGIAAEEMFSGRILFLPLGLDFKFLYKKKEKKEKWWSSSLYKVSHKCNAYTKTKTGTFEYSKELRWITLHKIKRYIYLCAYRSVRFHYFFLLVTQKRSVNINRISITFRCVQYYTQKEEKESNLTTFSSFLLILQSIHVPVYNPSELIRVSGENGECFYWQWSGCHPSPQNEVLIFYIWDFSSYDQQNPILEKKNPLKKEIVSCWLLPRAEI